MRIPNRNLALALKFSGIPKLKRISWQDLLLDGERAPF
jgi:hypothetical protein